MDLVVSACAWFEGFSLKVKSGNSWWWEILLLKKASIPAKLCSKITRLVKKRTS